MDLERLLGPDDLLQLRLLPTLPPARQVAKLDELLEHQRQASSALAKQRRQAIAVLIAEVGSVQAAAQALGVSRQAIYRSQEGAGP